MGGILSRERFGRPQVLAATLLLAFLAQCLWLCGYAARHVQQAEILRVDEGLRQWNGKGIAGTSQGKPEPQLGTEYPTIETFSGSAGFDANRSPVWYLAAAAGLVVWPVQPYVYGIWGWLARVPYLAFGLLLGASVWYVARRLYGNAGGYIALTLYCFSPAILRSTVMWNAEPEIGAAWGAFGAVFTAIAVAHTLYAPREVVLWNWRRIMLLGLSLALAVGSQFSLLLVMPLALILMVYVAPNRKAATLAIWGAACGVAIFILLAAYFFHPGLFVAGLQHANFSVPLGAFGMRAAYGRVFNALRDAGPAFIVAMPVMIVVFVVWRRARYFGNAAPLFISILFLLAAVGTPHFPGMGFALVLLPFGFVFVAGIAADLLETKYRGVVLACVWGLLSAGAIWNVLQLAKVRG